MGRRGCPFVFDTDLEEIFSEEDADEFDNTMKMTFRCFPAKLSGVFNPLLVRDKILESSMQVTLF